MARRATTLNNVTGTAVTREIDSKYDVVKSVGEKLPEVEKVGVAIDDGTMAKAVAIVDMAVATGNEGTSAVWDGTTLTVPKGDTGAQGVQGPVGNNGIDGITPVKGVDYDDGADGLIPDMELSYNATTGDLEYNVVGYTNLNTQVMEW